MWSCHSPAPKCLMIPVSYWTNDEIFSIGVPGPWPSGLSLLSLPVPHSFCYVVSLTVSQMEHFTITLVRCTSLTQSPPPVQNLPKFSPGGTNLCFSHILVLLFFCPFNQYFHCCVASLVCMCRGPPCYRNEGSLGVKVMSCSSSVP